MSTKRNVIMTGVATFVVAMIIISALSYWGFGSNFSNTVSTTTLTVTTGTSQSTTVTSPTSSTYTTSSTTSTVTSSTTYTTTPTTTYTTTTTTTVSKTEGVLSIQLTDPPILPDGVTAVYVNYSNIAVHVAPANDTHGWVEVNSTGTLNLMDLINVSQTISSVKIESGKYNLLRFNITSAIVTYDGKNYTAFVRTGQLKMPIIGGIEVTDSKPTTTIIDVQPTVFNIGNTSYPEFIISAVAKAYPVPENEEKPEMHRIGYRMGLVNKEWWNKLKENFPRQIEITSASLSQKSLEVAVKNTGSKNVTLKLVIVSQLLAIPQGENKPIATPIFTGAAVFVIGEDGSLKPITLVLEKTTAEEHAQTIFESKGYDLNVGSTIKLAYNGEIVFGFGLRVGEEPYQIVPGAKYSITIVGDGVLARTTVVAS